MPSLAYRPYSLCLGYDGVVWFVRMDTAIYFAKCMKVLQEKALSLLHIQRLTCGGVMHLNLTTQSLNLLGLSLQPTCMMSTFINRKSCKLIKKPCKWINRKIINSDIIASRLSLRRLNVLPWYHEADVFWALGIEPWRCSWEEDTENTGLLNATDNQFQYFSLLDCQGNAP